MIPGSGIGFGIGIAIAIEIDHKIENIFANEQADPRLR